MKLSPASSSAKRKPSTRSLTRGQVYYRKNRPWLREYQRGRYRNDPEFVAQRRAYNRRYAKLNREKLRETARQRWLADPEKGRRANRRAEQKRRSCPEGLAKTFIYAARTRVRKTGLALNITAGDILAVWPKNNRCPVLGTLFYFGPRRGRQRPDVATLDRLDSDKGYVRGNIAVISWRANDLKRNATVREIQQLLRWMKKIS